MYETEAASTATAWRGDAEYYRRRLRDDYTYERLLDLTCFDYVDALSRNHLLPMTRFATYLSTIWRRPENAVEDDMVRRIGEWIENGEAVLPDELQILAEQGELDLPFAVASTRAIHA